MISSNASWCSSSEIHSSAKYSTSLPQTTCNFSRQWQQVPRGTRSQLLAWFVLPHHSLPLTTQPWDSGPGRLAVRTPRLAQKPSRCRQPLPHRGSLRLWQKQNRCVPPSPPPPPSPPSRHEARSLPQHAPPGAPLHIPPPPSTPPTNSSPPPISPSAPPSTAPGPPNTLRQHPLRPPHHSANTDTPRPRRAPGSRRHAARPPARPPRRAGSPLFSRCRSRICVFSWDRSTCGRSRDGSARSAAAPWPCWDTAVGPAASPPARRPARRPPSPSRPTPRPPLSWRPRAGAGRRTGRWATRRRCRAPSAAPAASSRPSGSSRWCRSWRAPRRAALLTSAAAEAPYPAAQLRAGGARPSPPPGAGRREPAGRGRREPARAYARPSPLPAAALAPPVRRRGQRSSAARGAAWRSAGASAAPAPRPAGGAGRGGAGQAARRFPEAAGPWLTAPCPGEHREPSCSSVALGGFAGRGGHPLPSPPPPGKPRWCAPGWRPRPLGARSPAAARRCAFSPSQSSNAQKGSCSVTGLSRGKPRWEASGWNDRCSVRRGLFAGGHGSLTRGASGYLLKYSLKQPAINSGLRSVELSSYLIFLFVPFNSKHPLLKLK